MVSERWSDDDCHTFAFYELRTPKFAIDQKAAEESKVICESDLGIRPYDGKEFVRLTGRAVNLENKIIEKKVQRKDAIDDIDIERLEKELKQVRGEKFQMQVTP